MKGSRGLKPIPRSQLFLVQACMVIMISPLLAKFVVWLGASEWQRIAIVVIVDLTMCKGLVRLNSWLEKRQG